MNTYKTLTLPLITLLLFLPAFAAHGQGEMSGLEYASVQEPTTDGADDQLDYASRELRVRVWHDKDDEELYQRGESLRLFFRANADAYVVVYRIDADGLTEVVWPTSRYDDGFVFGGHTYTLPSRGSPIELRASNSRGVEYVEAIASSYPFDLRALGIDFRFDPDEDGRYNHKIEGDPFLAVNDINYAITGLEEDVDYVVTDWTHLYVDQKVDYARYSCSQCHNEEQDEYVVQPYTDTCTQVNIYTDWGWHTRWYSSFGYYPLYCDPSYYYWDRWYYRPYYYTYYPVYYSWPRYPVYVRPYPVYTWRSHNSYRGDWVVRYDRHQTRSGPLYDAQRGDSSKLADRGRGRGYDGPVSIDRGTARRDGSRVNPNTLVRHDGVPSRTRSSRDLTTVRATGPTRPGLRTGQAQSPRRVRSLSPQERGRDADSVRGATLSPRTPNTRGTLGQGADRTGGGRRWTRPVVRNTDSGRVHRAAPVTRGTTPTRGRDGVAASPRGVTPRSNGSTVDRTPQRSTPNRATTQPPRRSSAPKRVSPATGSGRKQSTNTNRATVKSRGGGGGSKKVTPPKRTSTPRKSTPQVRSSSKSGSGKSGGSASGRSGSGGSRGGSRGGGSRGGGSKGGSSGRGGRG